ncbi:AraC family transcriptional regulator [Anaerocolumna sp. AGMB13020]|uniref:helix-turn-helix transcriptional regulator n=1 Tax=Anaerocolumna sp. AGMB13020 TaxID=3081750 RepID=UPI002952991D|nr:AraC family transcriptional regulator [Anaerocolumna sp. AGMB13020]WOO38124.1 AraC family transcriptional regulator [Anaerocolumna sp. AGMB13020]
MLKIQYKNEEAMPKQVHCLWEGGEEVYEVSSEIRLPAALAWGAITITPAGRDINLCDTEMSFKKACSIQEAHIPASRIQLGFCLKDNLTWSYPSVSRKEFTVSEGEWFLQKGMIDSSISNFAKGQHCRGINISFKEQVVLQLLTSLNGEIKVKDEILKKGIIPSGVYLIIQQILNCPVRDNLRTLYLEGKILELLAVFLNEAVYETDKLAVRANISAEDYRCLVKAKEKIDRSFKESLTISGLAKEACINEYKLKTGFKQCFGYTVYGYIVHKRMELAYQLVQSGDYRVKDTAWRCGYVNVSHFIENFRKYYGITPGELRNG